MKIGVVGIGYVGLSNAVLLAQHNKVCAFDIKKEKVDMINRRESPIKDNEITKYLSRKELDITASINPKDAFGDADYVIIATPTDYDEKLNYFNTSSIECVIEQILEYNPNTVIVIKSTIPMGYTKKIVQRYNLTNVLFLPEFLREGRALYDNLYPSRIVVGLNKEISGLEEKAKQFVKLLCESAVKQDIPTMYVDYTEAEAIKLFSNTYLALRVVFFNELDTYAQMCGLDTEKIIHGVGLDPRIGNYYNNPSFGYGGYCLPKDTMQMLSNYKNIPQDVISAIIKSNLTRKRFVADVLLEKNPKVVGIYRLTMKANSDNYREAAVIDIIEMLKNDNVEVVIYEPTLKDDQFCKTNVIKDLDEFKRVSDVIAANRYNSELNDVKDKVYTRDLYYKD